MSAPPPSALPDPEWSAPQDPVGRWARRLGAYTWVEAALFELLGRTSADLSDDVAVAMTATHSRHHGWRAELWRGHLPLLGTAPPESFVAPPSSATRELFASLERGSAIGTLGDAVALAGVYRVVVPSLLAVYAAHGEAASPVSDAPTVRTLRIIGFDAGHDLAEGELALQRLTAGSDAAEAVEGHVERLEAVVAAGGGLFGVL